MQELVSATLYNTNNASQSKWNETFQTFAGATTHTFWITIPKNAMITNASLNLTGFDWWNDKYMTNCTFGGTTNYVNCTLNTSLPIMRNDYLVLNWGGSLSVSTNKTLSVNSTWSEENIYTPMYSIFTSSSLIYNNSNPADTGLGYPTIPPSVKYVNLTGVTITVLTLKEGSNPSRLDVWTTNWSSITNPWFDAGADGSHEWSASGVFNTVVNVNFITALQNYLTTCTPVNGTCNVPFQLHTDKSGKIQVSGIYITTLTNSWYCVGNTEYYVNGVGTIVLNQSCGACGCSGNRCRNLRDHWECFGNMSARHYTNCTIDRTQSCHFLCSAGTCLGEPECTSDSQCRNFCDISTSNLYDEPYCNNATGVCAWHSYEYCEYGCSDIFNTCNSQPIGSAATGVVVSMMGISAADAQTLLAIIISVIISTVITYIVSYKGGFGEGSIVFGISMIGMVVFFAVITPPWLNPVVMMILIILSGLLIAWKITQAVGG